MGVVLLLYENVLIPLCCLAISKALFVAVSHAEGNGC